MSKRAGLVTWKRVGGAFAGVCATVAAAFVLVGNPWTLAAAGPKPPPPPPPTITSGPTGSVTTTSATFTFTDSQSGVAFLCSLDGGTFASCSSPNTYDNLAAGTYTFRVTATYNGSNPSEPASQSWTVRDTTPPPAPEITRAPDEAERSKAKFTLTDAESGVTFRCSLSDGITTPPFTPCISPVQYKDVAPDEYCLRARAVDAAGNVSPTTEHCWASFEKKTFGVAGTAAAFHPGMSQPLDLVLSNPNGQPIKILSLTITIAQATTKNGLPNPDCDGTVNLTVTKGLTGTVIVPASSTRSLSQLVPQPQWPVLEMPNLSTNQDACKGTTFTISYSGTAAKA